MNSNVNEMEIMFEYYRIWIVEFSINRRPKKVINNLVILSILCKLFICYQNEFQHFLVGAFWSTQFLFIKCHQFIHKNIFFSRQRYTVTITISLMEMPFVIWLARKITIFRLDIAKSSLVEATHVYANQTQLHDKI